MARKPTRDELNAQIRGLEPFRELAWCLLRGAERHTLKSEGPDALTVEIYGPERACGGVALIAGVSAHFASEYAAKLAQTTDPYLRDLSHKITRLQVESLEKRDSARAVNRAWLAARE